MPLTLKNFYKQGWQPGANTIAYYTLDNNGTNLSTLSSKFSDITLNTATYSTTQKHGNHTKSLYCNGSTYAYIPASALHKFGTNDFTISVRVYSETNSGNQCGFISNYSNNIGTTTRSSVYRGYRISDRFSNSNKLNLCWAVGNSAGTHVAWYDGTTNTSISDGNWHNVVVTRNSGVLKTYLDGDTTPIVTESSYTTDYIGKDTNIYLGVNAGDGDYSKVYMNDLIFENKGRTAQEVSDYYTLTA